jgi:hypothetical protein
MLPWQAAVYWAAAVPTLALTLTSIKSFYVASFHV